MYLCISWPFWVATARHFCTISSNVYVWVLHFIRFDVWPWWHSIFGTVSTQQNKIWWPSWEGHRKTSNCIHETLSWCQWGLLHVGNSLEWPYWLTPKCLIWRYQPLGMEIEILLAPSILENVVSPPQLMAAMLANWGSGVDRVTLSWKQPIRIISQGRAASCIACYSIKVQYQHLEHLLPNTVGRWREKWK